MANSGVSEATGMGCGGKRRTPGSGALLDRESPVLHPPPLSLSLLP